jgi:G3E family GTPase
MATVVAPLKALYSKSFRVAPYSVLIDPTRARQIVLEKGFGGFSSKVAYIFLKQLEEAQVICLNKVDKLAQDETEALLAVLANEFPKARLLPISAWTGEGLAAWRELLDQPADASLNIAEVDYDVYADGEAELGWLNLTLRAEGKQPFDADALVARLLGSMKDRLEASGAEIAHIKALFQTDAGTSLANHTGGPYPPRLAQRIGRPVRAGQLVLNARFMAARTACAVSRWGRSKERSRTSARKGASRRARTFVRAARRRRIDSWLPENRARPRRVRDPGRGARIPQTRKTEAQP